MAPRTPKSEKIEGHPLGDLQLDGPEKIIPQGGVPADDAVAGEEGTAGAGAAAEASPGPEKSEGGGRRLAPLRIVEGGALSRDSAERFCIALAEGMSEPEAWKAAGCRSDSGSDLRDRRITVADPVFQARLDAMLQQKRADWFSGAHGEAMWGARQAMRMAQVAGDAAAVLRCAELMARIADRAAPAAAAGETVGEDGAVKRGPGRPATEPRQSKVDPMRIRRELLDKGMGAPELVQ